MELKQLQRNTIYRGKVFDLIVDEVEYPSGKKGVREIARHPGGSVIVPLLDDGRVVFVRQLRYPLGRHILELPAGKLSPGEDPEAAAERELTEETGWVAGDMKKLSAFYTTPGFCDEILHLYLATRLAPSPGGTRREEGEMSMTVEMHTFSEALSMVDRGEIEDGKTIVGLMLAARLLRSP